MRIPLAIVLAFHGLAHLVGFAGAWQLAPEGVPYKTTILDGHVDLGNAGIRVVGTLWLLTSVAFVVAATITVRDVQWWPQLALIVAMVSLLLSVAELPAARVGVVINVAIIAALMVMRRLAWV